MRMPPPRGGARRRQQAREHGDLLERVDRFGSERPDHRRPPGVADLSDTAGHDDTLGVESVTAAAIARPTAEADSSIAR